MSVLRYTPLFALGAWSLSSFAVGLGPLSLESGLGQPLRATIPVFEPGKNSVSARCISARVESFDGGFITNLEVDVPEARPPTVFSVSSRQIINEPAITIFIEYDCGSRVRRSYQSLLDLPASTSTLSSIGRPALQQSLVDNRLVPDAAATAVASEAGRPEENATKRRPPRQQAAPAKAGDEATARQPSETSVNRKNAIADSRPVLKLSTNDNPLVSRLKLSEVLVLPSTGGAVPPDAPTDEMQAARQAFSAMLRDENFLEKATREAEEAQRKLRDVQTQTASLARQNETGRLAYADLQRKSFSAILVAVLSGFLLFSVGTIGWLVVRLRRANRNDTKWWEGSNQADDSIETPTRSLFASASHPGEGEISSSFNMASIDQLYANAGVDRQEPTGDTGSGNRLETEFAGRRVQPFESSAGERRANDEMIFSHTVGNLPLHQGKMLKVEEVSDVVQEAEFWMLLNDPQRAVQILEPHANSERPDSPVAWLYLIDLYRMLGDRDKYTSLSERFKRIFNARIPKWEEQEGDSTPATLEDFPGLLNRILDAWNDHQLIVPFLESLLIDDRDGERIGFDLPVYREIILLIGIANETARMRLRA